MVYPWLTFELWMKVCRERSALKISLAGGFLAWLREKRRVAFGLGC
jgi:hypothetical protein